LPSLSPRSRLSSAYLCLAVIATERHIIGAFFGVGCTGIKVRVAAGIGRSIGREHGIKACYPFADTFGSFRHERGKVDILIGIIYEAGSPNV
jgi:hypothetical protein